jgi:hypothetical protein
MNLSFSTWCVTLNEAGLWSYKRPVTFRLLPAIRRNLLPRSWGYENDGLLQIVNEAVIPNPDMTFVLSVLVWDSIWLLCGSGDVLFALQSPSKIVEIYCERIWVLKDRMHFTSASKSFYFDVLPWVVQDNIWLRQICSITLICHVNFNTVCFAIVSSYLIWHAVTAVVIIVTVLLLPLVLQYYCYYCCY